MSTSIKDYSRVEEDTISPYEPYTDGLMSFKPKNSFTVDRERERAFKDGMSSGKNLMRQLNSAIRKTQETSEKKSTSVNEIREKEQADRTETSIFRRILKVLDGLKLSPQPHEETELPSEGLKNKKRDLTPIENKNRLKKSILS